MCSKAIARMVQLMSLASVFGWALEDQGKHGRTRRWCGRCFDDFLDLKVFWLAHRHTRQFDYLDLKLHKLAGANPKTLLDRKSLRDLGKPDDPMRLKFLDAEALVLDELSMAQADATMPCAFERR